MIRSNIGLVAFAAALGAAAPCLAEPGTSRPVSYRDLDLASPAGVAALKARVHAAVRRVCPDVDLRELRQLRGMTACRSEAARMADAQIAAVIDTAQRLAAREGATQVASR